MTTLKQNVTHRNYEVLGPAIDNFQTCSAKTAKEAAELYARRFWRPGPNEAIKVIVRNKVDTKQDEFLVTGTTLVSIKAERIRNGSTY